LRGKKRRRDAIPKRDLPKKKGLGHSNSKRAFLQAEVSSKPRNFGALAENGGDAGKNMGKRSTPAERGGRPFRGFFYLNRRKTREKAYEPVKKRKRNRFAAAKKMSV